MKTGIFGGAFNPPHIGHVQAAKTAFIQNKLDKLIIIPTGISPHKELPDGSPSSEMRFILTQNAFTGFDNIEISDIEIFDTEKNYTIDTVHKVRQMNPNDELFLFVGTDMYETLDTWKDSEELLKLITPILLPRNIINISSSEIRNMLPVRKGLEYLSDLNYAYIIQNRLYNAEPDWDWLREQAFSMLNPDRIPHVRACEVAAVQLAERWGADKDDARCAAILHDITKKLDFNENLCIIAEHGFSIDAFNKNEEKLLHSFTGALIARSKFGVNNNVIEAIKSHTTGKASMTVLDKIIYLADYTESTRDFPGVDNLRKTANEDIDKAMVTGLKMTADDLISRKITPDISTLEAIDDLTK